MISGWCILSSNNALILVLFVSRVRYHTIFTYICTFFCVISALSVLISLYVFVRYMILHSPHVLGIFIQSCAVHISHLIWKGVSATLWSGRYTLSYPRNKIFPLCHWYMPYKFSQISSCILHFAWFLLSGQIFSHSNSHSTKEMFFCFTVIKHPSRSKINGR